MLKRTFVAYRAAFSTLFKPPVVAIELTNRCNAHCTMCWRDEVKRKHTDIPFDDFKTIVLRAGDKGARVFQLSFFGESTLYKELVEAIAFIKKHYSDSVVVLNTNGAYLNDQLANQIIDAGVDQVRISIDGNNAEEYEKIRVGLKYETVRENVIGLWNLIQEKKAATQLLVQGLDLKEYTLDKEKYVKDWTPYAHKIATREEHDLIAQKKEPLLHKLLPCPKVFSQSIIMVNGEATICAYDWHGEIVVGNAIEEPAKSIWNSSIHWKFKVLHLLGMKRSLPLCKDCTYQMYPY